MGWAAALITVEFIAFAAAGFAENEKADLDKLDGSQFVSLAGVVERCPELEVPVRNWLVAGVTLRERDMWACRLYAAQRARPAALVYLRGQPGRS